MYQKNIFTDRISFAENPLPGHVPATQEEVNDNLLKKNKKDKLKQLDSYHFKSPELRTLKVNDSYDVLMTKEGRDLFSEQIFYLEQQIDLGMILPEDAVFSYCISGGAVDVPLIALKVIYSEIMRVVNANFQTYMNHKMAIENLESIEEVENYDFTANYLTNNTFNL